MMVPRLGAVGYAASASNEGRLPSLTLGGQALAAFFVRLAPPRPAGRPADFYLR